jgi:hypothetical protein
MKKDKTKPATAEEIAAARAACEDKHFQRWQRAVYGCGFREQDAAAQRAADIAAIHRICDEVWKLWAPPKETLH